MGEAYHSSNNNCLKSSQEDMEHAAFDWLNVLRYSGKTFMTKSERYSLDAEGSLTITLARQNGLSPLLLNPGIVGCLGSLRDEEDAEVYWKYLFVSSMRNSLSEKAHEQLISSSFEAWSDYISRNWQAPKKGKKLAISLLPDKRIIMPQIEYFTGPLKEIVPYIQEGFKL